MFFDSIKAAENYFKKISKEEVLGVFFELEFPAKIYERYKPNNPASREISYAFNEAYRVVSQNSDSRRGIGIAKPFSDADPPCISLIQILLRTEPVVISFFRSMCLENFSKDVGEVTRLSQNKFSSGNLKFVVGNLHKKCRQI